LIKIEGIAYNKASLSNGAYEELILQIEIIKLSIVIKNAGEIHLFLVLLYLKDVKSSSNIYPGQKEIIFLYSYTFKGPFHIFKYK
jgi:hypothetical protein